MVEVKTKKYEGTSSGGTATLEEALRNALTTAAQGERTNHFAWTLADVRGDFGGVVGKNITVEIRVAN
jgi:hypothetical protein